MISGYSNVSFHPNTNIIYLSKPQETSSNPRKAHIFGKYSFLEIAEARKSNFCKSWTSRAAENPDDPSNNILKILDMGSISSRKHEMKFW